MPPCLTLCSIRYVSRVKRSNTGKGVPPLHLSVVDMEKRAFGFTLDDGRQLYLQRGYIYIYIYNVKVCLCCPGAKCFEVFDRLL